MFLKFVFFYIWVGCGIYYIIGVIMLDMWYFIDESRFSVVNLRDIFYLRNLCVLWLFFELGLDDSRDIKLFKLGKFFVV